MNIDIKCFKIEKERNADVVMLEYGGLISETDYFLIFIESVEEIINIETYRLILTDIPFKLKLIAVGGNYTYGISFESLKEYYSNEGFNLEDYSKRFVMSETAYLFYKLFINYPAGRCNISFQRQDTSDNYAPIKEYELNITSPKLQESEFQDLIIYLQDKSLRIWEGKSLLENQAVAYNHLNKSLWLLYECERFVKALKNEYVSKFNFDKITVLEQSNYLVDYTSDVTISDDSLYWLANNLDVLIPTISHDIDKIKVNNRLVRPSQILANKLFESTDVTENRFIHGFIRELILFCIRIEQDYSYKKQQLQFPRKFQDEIEFFFLNKNEKRAIEIRKDLLKIKYQLDKGIPVSKEENSISFLNKITDKPHYKEVYKFYIEWLKHQNASYKKDKTPFVGIERMDKLFEKACYFKLIDVFTELGFEPNNTDILQPKTELIDNKNMNRNFSIYYELLPDSLTTINRGGVLKPDFIVELDGGNYIIIDAKYKTERNIEKYDYSSLTLKYLHGIGKKDGSNFRVIALLMLYPSKIEGYNFYQKREYNLFSAKPSLPAIGGLGLKFSEKSPDLKKVIEQCLTFMYI